MKETLDKVIDMLCDLSGEDVWGMGLRQEDLVIEYKNSLTNYLPEEIVKAKKYPKYRKSLIDISGFPWRDISHEVPNAFSFVFKDEINLEMVKEICSKRGFYTIEFNKTKGLRFDKDWTTDPDRKYQYDYLGVMRVSHYDMEIVMWVTKDAGHKLLLDKEEPKGIWDEIGFWGQARDVALVLIDDYLSIYKGVKK